MAKQRRLERDAVRTTKQSAFNLRSTRRDRPADRRRAPRRRRAPGRRARPAGRAVPARGGRTASPATDSGAIVPGRGRATRARLHHLRHRPGQPDHRDLKLIPDVARQLPQVTECYRITGDDCYFMKVHLRSSTSSSRSWTGSRRWAAPPPRSSTQPRPAPTAPRHLDRAEAGRRRSRLSRSPPARTQTTVLNAP